MKYENNNIRSLIDGFITLLFVTSIKSCLKLFKMCRVIAHALINRLWSLTSYLTFMFYRSCSSHWARSNKDKHYASKMRNEGLDRSDPSQARVPGLSEIHVHVRDITPASKPGLKLVALTVKIFKINDRISYQNHSRFLVTGANNY